MPDLTFRRGAPPPVKMVCMYCGRRATHAREKRITNPRLDPPGGGADHGLSDVPRADDPISGCVALLMLPLVLVGLGRMLRDDLRHRAALKSAPPLDPPYTVVTLTTCDRHRNYGRRFVWAGVAGGLGLAAGWTATVLGGLNAPLWVVGGTVVGSVAFPIVFLMRWGMHGPVRVSAAARDTVTLTDVREAYFEARE